MHHDIPPLDPDDLIVLVLRPIADPNIRKGWPERDVMYRLKGALKVLGRSYGLTCTQVRNPTVEEVKQVIEELKQLEEPQ